MNSFPENNLQFGLIYILTEMASVLFGLTDAQKGFSEKTLEQSC